MKISSEYFGKMGGWLISMIKLSTYWSTNLKRNYGKSSDNANIKIKASTNAKEDTYNYYGKRIFLFMSAENMNGVLFEQYLAALF